MVGKAWLTRIGLTAALAVAAAAHAAPGVAPELYQETVIVTGTDMRSRPTGFARALLAVLVKVAGNSRLAADPRAAAMAAHADALVTAFDYVDPMAHRRPHDDQGSYDRSYDLTVRFDPAKIDRALDELGEAPWTGERPVFMPLISVRGSDPPWVGAYLLTADGEQGAPQRAAMANAASAFGVTLRLPSAAELQARGVRVDGAMPDRIGPDGAVSIVGAIEFRPSAMGWVGTWRVRYRDAERSSSVRGVSFDAAFDAMLREGVVLASGKPD